MHGTMYYIRPNKSTAMPTRMLFLDSETTTKTQGREEILKMDIATTAYIDTKTKHSWDNPHWVLHDNSEQLAKYVDTKCYTSRKLYVFAHNIFFDIQACSFYKHLAELGYKFSFCHDKIWNFILTVRKGKKSMCFLSTTNFYAMGLNQLGQELNLPKMEVDFDNVSREKLIEYNKRDVEIIIAGMKRYIDFLVKHDCGKFSLTRASQAFSAFRHRFMSRKICVHRNEEVKQLERNAYFGGRNECFHVGKLPEDKYVTLDVNSMYPSVMLDNLYPSKLRGYTKKLNVAGLKRFVNRFMCIAHVQVKTNEPAYAIRANGKLMFPTGRFDTYLTQPDLEYAFKQGHVKKVYETAFYYRDKIFTDYVKYFYNLKQQAKKDNNKLDAVCTKIFLNSLYGKFGQQNDVETITDNNNSALFHKEIALDGVTGNFQIITDILGKRVVKEGKEDASHTFTAIAATVTAYARQKLYQAIKKIGFDKVLYCDTDSIIVRKIHLVDSGLEIDQHKLGAWGVEAEYKNLEITCCKHYTAGKKKCIKGIPSNAVKVGKNKYEFWQWCGQTTHLEEGRNSGFIRRKVHKYVSGVYDKGVVHKNGKVTPFRLPGGNTKIF